ncbi:MAG TPA: hypothetical protein VIY48_06395 [Candidatus Paceibacterota bacterium]
MATAEQIQKIAQDRYEAALLADKANRTAMYSAADFIESADLYQCNWLMSALLERMGELVEEEPESDKPSQSEIEARMEAAEMRFDAMRDNQLTGD